MVDMRLDPQSWQWYDADAGADQETSWLPPGESPFPFPELGNQNQLGIPLNSGLSLVAPWPDANFPGGGENTTGQPGTYGAPADFASGMRFLGPNPNYPATMPGSLETGSLGNMTENERQQQELAVRKEEQRIREHAADAAATKQYNDTRLRQYQQEIDDKRARGREPTAAEEAQLQTLRNQAAASERANQLAQQELAANTSYRNASLAQQGSHFGQTLAEQQAARAQSAAQFERTFAYQQQKDRMALGQQFLSTMIQEIGRIPSPDLLHAFFQMLSADSPSGVAAAGAPGRAPPPMALPLEEGARGGPGPALPARQTAMGAVAPSAVDSWGHPNPVPGQQLYPDRWGNMVWALHPMLGGTPAAAQGYSAAAQAPVSAGPPVTAQRPVSAPAARVPVAAAAPPVPVARPAAPVWKPYANADYVRNPLTGYLQRS